MAAETTENRSPTRLRAPGSKVPTAAALLLAAAIGVGQVSAYALNLVAAHRMGPALFGELASLLAILLVASVAALGIQAAGARRVVLLGPKERPRGSAAVLQDSIWAALIVAGITAALSPLLVRLLHLSGPIPVLLIAVALFPATIMGGQLGVTQGQESHGRLSAVYLMTGLGRAGGGIIGVFAVGTVVGACLGLALGLGLAVALGFLILAPLVKRPAIRMPKLRGDMLHASHSLFVLFVLTNVDVLLARHFLPAEQAGMYAAGAVVAKVAFWLPQFIGVIAYPRMADHRRGRTLLLAASAVATIGVLLTAIVALLPNLVVSFVGGSQYAGLSGQVWMFAAEGAAFSFTQFLLYSQLAENNRLAVLVLWAGTVALIGLVFVYHDSIAQIVSSVLAVSAVICLIGVIDMIVERRKLSEPTRIVGV
ncbi:MAG: hypothetical protein Q8Q29_02125 [Actinomycetota bacterium]|nr:hypothetical protein [Actinomycetota bacterium]